MNIIKFIGNISLPITHRIFGMGDRLRTWYGSNAQNSPRGLGLEISELVHLDSQLRLGVDDHEVPTTVTNLSWLIVLV